MNDSSKIWDFISIQDYFKPSYTYESSLKTRILKFPKIFRKSNKEVSIMDLDKLKEFSDLKLNKIAVKPDFSEAIANLDLKLAEWTKSPPFPNNIVFILCPPFSFTREIVEIWGKNNNLSILTNPGNAEILSNSSEWLEKVKKNTENPFILPNLEKCYLRFHKGLSLIRGLFAHLWHTDCKAIICVDTWAWIYLKRAIEIDVFGMEKLVLQPFTYEKLDDWFNSLKKDSISRKIVFRKVNDGNYVISPPNLEELPKKERKIDNSFLKNLSVFSEGNPGIAWTIWRFSLRIEPDEEFLEKDEHTEDIKKNIVIWVIPWERLKFPGRIEEVERSELLILHAILIHGGLEEYLFSLILSLSETQVLLSLNVLKISKLVFKKDKSWNITNLGYAYVKKLLSNYGFLVDKIEEIK